MFKTCLFLVLVKSDSNILFFFFLAAHRLPDTVWSVSVKMFVSLNVKLALYAETTS